MFLAGSISSVEAPLDLPDFISVNIKRKPSCMRQWNLRKKSSVRITLIFETKKPALNLLQTDPLFMKNI